MKNSMLLSYLAVISMYFDITTAKDICDLKNGTAEYCPDRGSSIGYCCNLVDGHYQNCCFYTAVWGLWYFWTPLVLFLIMVTLCACAASMCSKNSKSRQSSVQNLEYGVGVQRQTVVAPGVVAYQTTNEHVARVNDVPPSYQQIQEQGVAAQFQAMDNYQTKPAMAATSSSSSSDEN